MDMTEQTKIMRINYQLYCSNLSYKLRFTCVLAAHVWNRYMDINTSIGAYIGVNEQYSQQIDSVLVYIVINLLSD